MTMATKCETTAIVVLMVLLLSAFIAGVTYLNWNYCHQAGKGPCRKEKGERIAPPRAKGPTHKYVYARSNLTPAQKKKCEKLESGMISLSYRKTVAQHAIT